MVKATREKALTSWAGSAERTTRSASIPLPMRPECAEKPKRSAGFVVREARICWKLMQDAMGRQLPDHFLCIRHGVARHYIEPRPNLLCDDLVERSCTVGRLPEDCGCLAEGEQSRIDLGHDHHLIVQLARVDLGASR